MKDLLRRVVRQLVTLVLRLASQPYEAKAGGNCVVIAPHQDDETLGCGGLIHAQRAAERTVSIIYITDGAGSHPNHPRLNPNAIAQLRREEATSALQHLGVAPSALFFLDTPDGTLAHLTPTHVEDVTLRLSALLKSLQPTELFLPCRDDGSSEHTAAFILTERALQRSNLAPRRLEYPVWARWSPLRLLRPWWQSRRTNRLAFPGSLASKRAALSAYKSQAEPTPPWTQPVLPRGFLACFESSEEFFFER